MLPVNLDALKNKSPLEESIAQFLENQYEVIDLPFKIKEVEAEHRKLAQSKTSLSLKEGEQLSALYDELHELKDRLKTAETKQKLAKSELSGHLKKIEPNKITYQHLGETYELWYNPINGGVSCIKQ